MIHAGQRNSILICLALYAPAAQYAFGQGGRESDACTAPMVPAYALSYLRQKYPEWKIKQPSDFRSLSDRSSQRQQWLWYTHRSCPGVAAGKFQPGPELTYAFLLIPAAKTVTGFKLVVVTRDTKGMIQSRTLASPLPEDGGWQDDDWLIRGVNTVGYGGYPRPAVPPTMTQGILLSGVRAYLCGWPADRFKCSFVHGVDRNQ